MTSTALVGASALLILIGIAHSWIGERRLIGPLLRPDSGSKLLDRSPFAGQTLRFAWHITTIAWWGTAAALIILARPPITGQGRAILVAIAATYAITGLITLVASRGRHLAWPVFFAIAGLTASAVL
jgi:hypothetical protein